MTKGGMLKEKDWFRGSFWIVFDSEQCERNLHKEQRIQDRHCLHVSLFVPFSKAEVCTWELSHRRSSRAGVIQSLQREPKSGQKTDFSLYIGRTESGLQWKLKTRMFSGELKRYPWPLPQKKFKCPICLSWLLVPWCREERQAEWIDLVSFIHDVST